MTVARSELFHRQNHSTEQPQPSEFEIATFIAIATEFTSSPERQDRFFFLVFFRSLYDLNGFRRGICCACATPTSFSCAPTQQNCSCWCLLPLAAGLWRPPAAFLIISNPPCGRRDKKKPLRDSACSTDCN